MPSVGGTHDIRIGSDYFLIRPGSYVKRAAPMFGARFATGDPNYNNLSFWQHWAQTCWVGGFGAETWQDDAMFDQGVGVDASQHEVMTLSRDLAPLSTGAAFNAGLIRIFTVFQGKLYVLQTNSATNSKLYHLDDATQAWVLDYTWGGSVQMRWFEVYGSYLYVGGTSTNLYRWNGSAMATYAKPAGSDTKACYTLKAYRGVLYVALEEEIWRINSSHVWDGSTVFHDAPDVTYFNQAEVHLGFLYFASRNGHIVRTDGNNTFDLWAFEPHVVIWGLRSFDGRLFIGAAEELDGTTSAQTVLYQFSGASVTELKRWGKVGYDTTPGKLRAFGRSLFFGASNLLGMGSVDGFGVARYDPVEDAYHLFASNLDYVAYPPGSEGVNTTVDDVFFWKGWLYCSVRGYGVFRTKWSFKDVTRFQATYDVSAAGANIGAKNGGWYESSDFDAGTPGLRKLWNAITVHIDLPDASCSAYVEISSDGGQTWAPAGGSTAAASITKTSALTRYAPTIILQDNQSGSADGFFATRLKYRVTLRTTDTDFSPQLRGVIVRYLPVPEPNWQWDVTVVLSEKQGLHDNTDETVDVDARLAALQTSFRDGELVEFQDIDGTVWAGANQPGVLITDMVVSAPLITSSSFGDREYEVRLTLHEAVESY